MGAALKAIEHRASRRLPVRVLVEYESLEDFLIDYTANISIGGMFIRTEKPLAVGTRFRLRFRVPGRKKPIATYGEVRWAMGEGDVGGHPGMGISFDELLPGDLRCVEGMFDSWEAELSG